MNHEYYSVLKQNVFLNPTSLVKASLWTSWSVSSASLLPVDFWFRNTFYYPSSNIWSKANNLLFMLLLSSFQSICRETPSQQTPSLAILVLPLLGPWFRSYVHSHLRTYYKDVSCIYHINPNPFKKTITCHTLMGLFS